MHLKRAGVHAAEARAGLVLLHGRGGSADDMWQFSADLAAPQFALVAPEAIVRSWWPMSFLSPMALLELSLEASLDEAVRAISVFEDEGLS